MKEIKLYNFFIRILVFFSVVLILILAFLVSFDIYTNIRQSRMGRIEKELNFVEYTIKSKITEKINEVNFLSKTIVLSQINNPRSFINFDGIFRDYLASNMYVTEIDLVLLPGKVLYDPNLISITDSLGRLNVSWIKSSSGVIFLDSSRQYINSLYFNTAKKLKDGDVFVLKAKKQFRENTSEIIKTFIVPIYQKGTYVGFLSFSMSVGFIKDILASNEYKDEIFIADENGSLLYAGKNDELLGGYFNKLTDKDFKKYQNKIIQNEKFFARNKKNIIIFKPLKIKNNLVWKEGLTGNIKLVSFSDFQAVLMFLSVFVFLELIAILIFRLLFLKVYSFTEIFIDKVKTLSRGNLDFIFDEDYYFYEVKELTESLKFLQNRLKKLVEIHQALAEQKEKELLEPVDKNDQLAHSINHTVKVISERRGNRLLVEKNKERDDWINTGMNELHSASRVEEHSIERLLDKINETITVYADAYISSIFILDENDGKKFLRAISTFGLNEKRAFKKKIDFGEGLIGTVALEKKPFYIDKIPDDYHIIIAGLSEMIPKSILIQPLLYENEFFGVMELSFLRILEDYELEFFNRASSEIALSIKSILNNIARDKLVKQLQEQSKIVENSQKLLKEKIEELKKKESQMQRNQADLQAVINAVNNTLMTIEYTTSGVLLTANEKYLRTMGYTIDELKGVNVLDLVKSERAELENVIKRVSNGENYEKVMKRFTKYGEVRWLFSTYTPYYNINGKITKILYFAFDVTDSIKYKEKLEREIKILRKQLKILREKM